MRIAIALVLAALIGGSLSACTGPADKGSVAQEMRLKGGTGHPGYDR